MKTDNLDLNLFRLFLTLLLVSIYLSSASFTQAANYYASPSGSSTADCSSYSTACSLNTSLSKLGAGDTLYLLGGGGSYYQTVSISKSNITIAGYPGETAIIDGRETIPSGSDWDPLVNITGSYVIFRDIEVTRSNGSGIDVFGSHSQIINVYAHHNHEAGILLIGDYTVADGCRIYYNSMHNENGKQLVNGGGWGTGISACRHPSYASIKNTVSWNNWGEGLSTFGADHTTLENNIVYDNWSVNMYIQNVQYALIQRNLIYRTANNIFTRAGVQNSQGRERGIAEDNEAGDAQYGISSNNTYINNLVMGAIANFVHWNSGQGMVNAIIANNTFVNSTDKPNVQIAGTGSNVQFRNNIIVQDDSLSLASIGSGVTKSNNLWSRDYSGRSAGDFIGNPNLSRQGTFAPGQLTGAWFKLTSNSTFAIDKAVSLVQVTDDFFKMVRPYGSLPDIGAHEYRGSQSTPTPTPSSCNKSQGDANCDGKINTIDFAIWVKTRCSQNCTQLEADFNGDGKVDVNDIWIWFGNMGNL